MTLVDLATANAVQASMAAPRFVSGGSVANTTAGIAELGGTAGFVGAVADDEVGRTYAENLRAAGVEFEPHLSESAAGDGLGTGRCIVLITERRRPHHGDVSGGGLHHVAGRCAGGLRRPGVDLAARGLSVGRPGGQGGHAARRGHRPRRRRFRRAVPVRSLLRGTASEGVPGPAARRRRHPARQRGGGDHAVRRGVLSERGWPQPRRPGCWS